MAYHIVCDTHSIQYFVCFYCFLPFLLFTYFSWMVLIRKTRIIKQNGFQVNFVSLLFHLKKCVGGGLTNLFRRLALASKIQFFSTKKSSFWSKIVCFFFMVFCEDVEEIVFCSFIKLNSIDLISILLLNRKEWPYHHYKHNSCVSLFRFWNLKYSSFVY